MGAFTLVSFALDPSLFPLPVFGEVGCFGVETFGEATWGVDPFTNGDKGLSKQGGTEGLKGGGGDELPIRGFQE